jgi:putative membrane protein
MKEHARDILYGIIVGVANIIPGVSGGTMALVLGFYERLIGAINSISGATVISCIRALTLNKEHRDAFREEFVRIEGPFMIKLMAGALISIGALAKLMSWLLEQQHDPTYGFFFGLVLVSAYTPWSLIKKKTIPVMLSIAIAAAGIIAVSELMSDDDIIRKAEARHQVTVQAEGAPALPAAGIGTYAYHFLSGAVAISAMILPGISGSFVLLLMGGYFDILKAISTLNLPVLGVFAAGCLAGIIAFTRLLNYLLRRFYDPTLGFLLGLVAGSLWVIWPFKSSVMVANQAVYLSNRIPDSFGAHEIVTLGAFLAGAAVVTLMIWIERKNAFFINQQ